MRDIRIKVFVGTKGSGKDFFGKLWREECIFRDFATDHIYFAAPLKEAVQLTLSSLNSNFQAHHLHLRSVKEKYRSLLIDVADAADPFIFAHKACSKLTQVILSKTKGSMAIAITDLRFEKEFFFLMSTLAYLQYEKGIRCDLEFVILKKPFFADLITNKGDREVKNVINLIKKYKLPYQSFTNYFNYKSQVEIRNALLQHGPDNDLKDY